MQREIPNPTDPSSFEPSGQVLEVTAMLGDSVVGLSHVDPSPGPSARRAAYLLYGAGAALLLLAAVTFAYGVRVAAANERALARFVAEGRPVHDFRPRRLGLGYDVLALGGLFGGIVAAGFGLALSRRDRRRASFTVGSDPEADFSTGDAPVDRFELIAPGPAGPRVRIWDGMRAELDTPAGRTTLEEMRESGAAMNAPAGGCEIDLRGVSRVSLQSGPIRFFLGWVPAPRRASLAGGGFERRVTAFVLASAAVHLALLGMLQSIPPEGHTLGLDDEERGPRLATARVAPREEEKRELEEVGATIGQGREPGEARAQGKKGTVGEPEATKTRGRAAIEKRADAPQLARHQEIERARTRGIAGAMAARRDLFTSLTSQNPFSSGLDDADVRGGDYGPEVAAVYGPYGSEWGNAVNDFSGSPYWQDGLIRAGELPRGRPWGDPRFGGGTDLPGSRPGRHSRAPSVETGPAEVPPEWDAAIIRRHVRRQLRRVRHCYEKTLLSEPGLAGTAVASFSITAQGTVLGARTRGMNSKSLHRCISGVVASIQFPRSPNGAAANVRYPFHLRQAGR